MDEGTDTGRADSLRDRILTHVAVAAWRLAEGEGGNVNPVATAIFEAQGEPTAGGAPPYPATPGLSRCTAVVPYHPPTTPVASPAETDADEPRSRIDRALACARSRRVGPWCLGYLVFALGGVQVVESLGSIFDLSTIIQQSAVTVLACGFPAALVLSWYHGERGPQRATLCEIVLLTILLVVSTLVVGTMWVGGP